MIEEIVEQYYDEEILKADADATNDHKKPSKSKLLRGTDTWNKAVDYLKKGGSMSDITSKYLMSQEAQDILATEGLK